MSRHIALVERSLMLINIGRLAHTAGIVLIAIAQILMVWA